MANLEKVESIVGGLRQVIQDLVAPELRELRAEMRAFGSRIERIETRMEKLEEAMTRGFEDVRRQLDTYKDVQMLKERMARMEGERGAPLAEPSAERPAHGPA